MSMPTELWYRDVVNKKGDNKMINDTTKLEPKQIGTILTDAHAIADHIIRNVEAVSMILWNRVIDSEKEPAIEPTCAMEDLRDLVAKLLYIGGLLEEILFQFSGRDASEPEKPHDSDTVESVLCFRYYLDIGNEALDRSIALSAELHTAIYGVGDTSDDDGYGYNEFAPALKQLGFLVEKMRLLETYTTDIINAFSAPSIKSEPVFTKL